MYVHKVASGLAPNTTSASYSLAEKLTDLRSQNNIGVVQILHEAGSGTTVILQGSSDGLTFIDLATGLTAATGKTVALLPYLRASSSGGTGTVVVYVVH